MHFKMNNKINQVIENTLVVGIDIAKRVHNAELKSEKQRNEKSLNVSLSI